MQKHVIIHALHGFLGGPSDWLLNRTADFDFKLRAEVIFDDCFTGKTMREWAEAFNARVFGQRDQNKNAVKVLLGYSMGGRLAMHALLQAPHIWDMAIFVSANTGLKDPVARVERKASDEDWAKQFESEEWPSLMKKWNDQTVFTGSLAVSVRKECDFNRGQLAAVLRNWSLGCQECLDDRLAELCVPTLWVAGELDRRYSAIASEAGKKFSFYKAAIIQGAGHRVPWDRGDVFFKTVSEFIKTNLKCTEG